MSAGVTSLVLFGKMNVSEAHLNQKDRNVLGSQVIKCIKPKFTFDFSYFQAYALKETSDHTYFDNLDIY